MWDDCILQSRRKFSELFPNFCGLNPNLLPNQASPMPNFVDVTEIWPNWESAPTGEFFKGAFFI